MKVTDSRQHSLWVDDEGQDLIEYALLAALIAPASFAAMHNFGARLGSGCTGSGRKL